MELDKTYWDEHYRACQFPAGCALDTRFGQPGKVAFNLDKTERCKPMRGRSVCRRIAEVDPVCPVPPPPPRPCPLVYAPVCLLNAEGGWLFINECAADHHSWRVTGEEGRDTGILVPFHHVANATAGDWAGSNWRKRLQRRCNALHKISFKMRCPKALNRHCFNVGGERRTFRTKCEGFKRYPWLFKNTALIRKHVRKGACKKKPQPCTREYAPVCAMYQFGNKCEAGVVRPQIMSGELQKGECDDGTGAAWAGKMLPQKYMDPDLMCPAVYQPVCARRTFSNRCMAEQSADTKWQFATLVEGACPKPTTTPAPTTAAPVYCPTIYQPVCVIKKTMSTGEETRKTFSNRCEAEKAGHPVNSNKCYQLSDCGDAGQFCGYDCVPQPSNALPDPDMSGATRRLEHDQLGTCAMWCYRQRSLRRLQSGESPLPGGQKEWHDTGISRIVDGDCDAVTTSPPWTAVPVTTGGPGPLTVPPPCDD